MDAFFMNLVHNIEQPYSQAHEYYIAWIHCTQMQKCTKLTTSNMDTLYCKLHHTFNNVKAPMEVYNFENEKN